MVEIGDVSCNKLYILSQIKTQIISTSTLVGLIKWWFNGCVLFSDYKTSNYIETNLASVDNSATPNLKHSQVHAIDSDTGDMNFAINEEQPADWLGCIAKKTGLPRMLLSFTIFISAIVMIWLCFTTAATAPEQRVRAPVSIIATYVSDYSLFPEHDSHIHWM